jgi:hypothetical protein
VLRPLGYRFPLGIKRGYHMHYRPEGNASLARPVLDAQNGYVITSMTAGIRLTTGAEFATRDAPPTPRQLDRVEPLARAIFPLGARVDPEPWLGRRPCLPDMLPIIGAAPRHKGLWLDFGHHHLGLTLGPVSGRLLAEMMTGESPLHGPDAVSGRAVLAIGQAVAGTGHGIQDCKCRSSRTDLPRHERQGRAGDRRQQRHRPGDARAFRAAGGQGGDRQPRRSQRSQRVEGPRQRLATCSGKPPTSRRAARLRA